MPATLLFDLDGTLVDSALDIAAALSALRVERGGGVVTAGTVRPLVSLGAETLVRSALGAQARDAADDVARFRTLLAAIVPDRDRVFPEVTEALDALAAAGHRMAIVTNKPETLARTLLEALGLARRFEVVVGGDTLPTRKPDPAPLHHALRAIGGEPAGALMIGDSPVDLVAAAACGIPFLLYEGGYDAAACDDAGVAARFGRFAVLPRLVGQVAARRLVLSGASASRG